MALPRSLPPSEDERLDVLRRHMTSGNAAGMSRAVGPIYRRDLARAAVVGSGDEGSLDQRESKIDTFTVTGAGTSAFTLTFDPVDDSWNVSCSWDLVSGADYTISARTLTVTAPAATFVGASATFPKTLQVQYDYLAGVPVAPSEFTALFVASSPQQVSGAAVDPPYPSGLVAGDVVFALHVTSGPTSPSYPAGWTALSGATVLIGGARATLFEHVYTGGEGATVGSISLPADSGYQQAHLVAFRSLGARGAVTAHTATGVTYTVPSALSSVGAVRFVVMGWSNEAPDVAGVTEDYQTTGSPVRAVAIYHEAMPPSRVAASATNVSSLDWGSITVPVS